MSGVVQMTAAARVLLADDTPDIRALLRLVLSRHDDFDVVAEAADGSEAIDMARLHQPDLVLLDLAMPVMDGLEAIPGVRAAVPRSKIVVLSGFNADQMADEALRAGADAYIEKGTPPLRLVTELRRICGLGEAPPPDGPSVVTRPEPEPEPEPHKATPPWGAEELAFVNHELVSPLAVIEGFAALLERKPGAFSPDQISEQAASIKRSARHVRALLQALTDARRLETADVTIERVSTDAAVLVREVVQDLRAITGGHPVEVVGPESLPASVDPVRMRQILTNLVSNAAKFSPEDSPIVVQVAAGGETVEVVVRDKGPGIAPERRAELFGRFARLDTDVKGMGLGLYISQRLARAHGGELVLADDGPPGATFVLRLPRN